MARTAWLKYDGAVKIWELHEYGLKNSKIAQVLGLSLNTISRIVMTFMAAKDGDFAKLRQKHPNHISYALRYFGIDEALVYEPEKSKEEPVQEAAPEKIADNSAEYLLQMLAEIKRTNELLEKLCNAWGV